MNIQTVQAVEKPLEESWFQTPSARKQILIMIRLLGANAVLGS